MLNGRAASRRALSTYFVVFDGLNDGTVVQVTFVEVKAGSSALSARERQVRDAVKAGRVRWEELRVASELST